MNHGPKAPAAPNSHGPAAVVIGWALVAAFVALCAWLGDISRHVRLFQAGYLVGFIGFGLLAHAVCVRRPPGQWGAWLAGCVILRIALLPTTPSDDLYRYLWEGRVQVAGHNPFAAAPDDPSLTDLRDRNWDHINHRDYPAIYPPLAQMQFLLVAWIAPTLAGVKTLYVLFDVAAVILLGIWLKCEDRSPHLAILYGLCPLTLTAVAVQGHLDSAMIALMAAAGIADARRRPYLCATFLGAAILTKIVPIVLLPWLVRRNWRAAAWALVIVLIGYLPYVERDAALFHSLLRFPRSTELLSLGHEVARHVLDADASRVACAIVVLIVALRRAQKPSALSENLLTLFGVLLLCLPVVHFWYLTWVLMALPFRPRIAWIVLCASMVFYFEAPHIEAVTGQWSMPPWVIYPVYAPFIIAATVEYALRRRAAS